jgi:hypothetical protein
MDATAGGKIGIGADAPRIFERVGTSMIFFRRMKKGGTI